PKTIAKARVPRSAPILADVDGDGRLDLIANTNIPTKLKIFSGAGRGIRVAPRRMAESPRFRPFRAREEPLSAGDLDGDGRPRLSAGPDYPVSPMLYRGLFIYLVQPYDGTDYLNVLHAGTALPGWPVAFPFPAAEKTYGPGIASIADVDGDGALDVVTGTGTCAFWGYPQQPSLRRGYTG